MESKTIDLTTATGSIVEKQTINNNDIFDEVDTDEGAVKKNLNVLLNVTPSFTSHKWGEIHKALNNGIVGKEVPAKDCYRIGFINNLKEFAKTHNILFARDGNKLYVYSGEYWISISEELMKEFLHKAASKMGIPHSLSYCVKFIKGVYSQLSELGFYEKMVKSETTYLNLSNGALKIDINGVELVDFNPKYFLTHKLDFAYDINAKNQRWLDFLDMVIPDKDTQKTLQQALGYLFIRDLKLELVFFLYGIGANGKSVIFEVIKGLLAPDMMSYYSLVHLTNKLGYQVADLSTYPKRIPIYL